MENVEKNLLKDSTFYFAYKKIYRCILRDRYKFRMLICLTVGILLGCITQSVYGESHSWQDVLECYCYDFFTPLCAVFPVTLGFVAVLFVAASASYIRLVIYPLSAVRAMGIGALLCGALQCGSLRELCFATLVLLPYSAINCVITVYAGEYALGLKESFTCENEALTRSLIIHSFKMLLFYLAIAATSCVLFAGSCVFFGAYLM